MDKLVIHTRDTITIAPSSPIQNLAPCYLFSTPKSLFQTALTSSSTQKKDRDRSITLSGDVMIFTGSLDFLDSQDSFNIIFGDDSTILSLTLHKKKQSATEDTDYLHSKVNEFCNLCHFHIFCDFIQLKYVGTDFYNS